MASINGISIKSLHKFRGHDGEPLAQGMVYYKGKRLGYWSQDFHGGPDAYEFDAKVLNDEVAKYRESGRVEEDYKEYVDLGSLLEDLVNLMETEKAFKNGFKAGYSAYIEANDGWRVWGVYHRAKPNMSKDSIINDPNVQGFIAECRARSFDRKKLVWGVYTCFADFDIVYGEV